METNDVKQIFHIKEFKELPMRMKNSKPIRERNQEFSVLFQ